MYPIHRSPLIARLGMLLILGLCMAGLARAEHGVVDSQFVIYNLDRATTTTYTGCWIVKEQWQAGSPGVSYVYALCVGNDNTRPMDPDDLPPGVGIRYASVWLSGELMFKSTGCWKVGEDLIYDPAIDKDVRSHRFTCTESLFKNGFDPAGPGS